MEHILICCVCLGDNSEDADEIIQCDNCGVTVHEGKLQGSTDIAVYVWFNRTAFAVSALNQYM